MCSRPCPEAQPGGGGSNLLAREGLGLFWEREAFRSHPRLQIPHLQIPNPGREGGAGVWGGPFGGTVFCREGGEFFIRAGPGLACSGLEQRPLGPPATSSCHLALTRRPAW